MGSPGPQFYDDDAVFATYMQHRQSPDNPNGTLEKPVMRELLGTVDGKRILDLGCGDAAIGRELLDQGAAAYTGVEGSAKMVTVATQTLAGTPGQVMEHTIEDWSYPRAAIDLVIARLVLHYVADLPALCSQVFGTLVPGDTGLRVTSWLGGRVQKYHRTVEDYFMTLQRSGFSIEHLRESCPQREHFQDEQTYARRRRIPLFLFLTGCKPIV